MFCVKFTSIFHLPGMSLAWTAMVEFTWKIFPKEITTSGLGVIGSMMWIAPSLFSNLIGSQLYHVHGGPWLFRFASLYSNPSLFFFILLFISLTLYRIIDYERPFGFLTYISDYMKFDMWVCKCVFVQ